MAMDVYVVATTDAGTRAALTAARTFSRGLTRDITLIVPHTVPFPQPLDHPLVPVSFSIGRFTRIAADVDTDLSLRICVCRPGHCGFDALLPSNAVVLVGGVRRRLRRSSEEKLVDRLEARGQRALLVNY